MDTEESVLVTNLHCKFNVYAFFLRAFCSRLPCVTDFAQKLKWESNINYFPEVRMLFKLIKA